VKEETLIELMHLAIAEARKSVAEDGRIHPRVGAVLADEKGNVLHTAHRGENGPGTHAEFVLFEKARNAGTDTTRTHLFVTLEPCTRRSPQKIPCAARVAVSGVQTVYIGTLDPNPQITGRGEMFLWSEKTVERFPHALAKTLYELNRDFFEQHQHEHVPSVSIYAGGTEAGFRPVLARQREALLQQSMDLITGSEGEVWTSAGSLSWLREMQIGILLATLGNRGVRILCSAPREGLTGFDATVQAAQAIGASVCISKERFELRGTLAAPKTTNAAMICIERAPALHGNLFRAPHDNGVLDAMTAFFESSWRAGERFPAQSPKIIPLQEAWLVAALQAGVPAYATASIRLRRCRIDDLALLPKSLEKFKLFRLTQLAALKSRFDIPTAAAVLGSPWAIVPPIVEERADGQLVVIDGAHRVYSAALRQQVVIDVLLVSGVTEALPARPRKNSEDIRLGFERVPRAERYDEPVDAHFRPIRLALATALKNFGKVK
jgi:pyrimidine deaminase RibD-like protein